MKMMISIMITIITMISMITIITMMMMMSQTIERMMRLLDIYSYNIKRKISIEVVIMSLLYEVEATVFWHVIISGHGEDLSLEPLFRCCYY